MEIADVRMAEALSAIEGWLDGSAATPRLVFFVNAHTLNLAWEDPDYARILRRGDVVFGDGSGVRLAARLLHGVELVDNVNGTDLVPALLGRGAGRGRRYFLLGGTAEMVERAAAEARRMFPAWEQAGHHHGYLDASGTESALEAIRAARPQLLLVGMGNPLQERWLVENRDRLEVPVSLAIGGLFAYWSGDLDRAPPWMRRLGIEWIHLLVRQPRKAERYLLGNPRFVWRLLRSRRARRAPGA